MGLFSRGRDRATSDAALPPLTVEQADWLRECAAREFALLGLPVTDQGDHLLAADGSGYGLGNLAVNLAHVPRGQWPDLVRRHARSLVGARSQSDPASLEELSRLVIARVLADGPDVQPPAGAGPDADPGPAIADGLVVRAAADYPEHVSILLDLSRFGGWQAVAPYALANLRALPLPEHQVLRADGGGDVHVFTSDDLFGASRLLALDDLLSAALRVERPDHGVLVAMPNRHLLAVHLLEGPHVVGALHTLISLARSQVDGPGPVSSEVYYRSPTGTLQRITGPGENGGYGVFVTGAFAAAMESLGLVG